MQNFQENVQGKYMPVETAEEFCVRPMMDLYDSLKQILRDNNILKVDTMEEQ